MNKMDVLDSLHYLARLSRRFYSGGHGGWGSRPGGRRDRDKDGRGRGGERGHGEEKGGGRGRGRGERGGHGRGDRDRGRRASHSEMKLLHILEADQGMNARELAERLDIRPSSLSEALDRLEKRSLIQRSRDEKDSRVYWIKLTEQGKSEMENHSQEHNKARLEIEACLTKDEKKTFLEICEKLSAHLISLTTDSSIEDNTEDNQ